MDHRDCLGIYWIGSIRIHKENCYTNQYAFIKGTRRLGVSFHLKPEQKQIS
jgi:hypothetical protein